jgi:FkbM family methyltransferase
MKDKNYYSGVNAVPNIPLVKKYISEASCVFEIGANDGVDIPSIHELWPDAEIHVFEIEPFHYPRLFRFMSEYIHVNFFGLYNYDGKVKFNRILEDNKSFDQYDYWYKTASGIKKLCSYMGQPKPNTDLVNCNVLTIDTYCNLFKCKPDILLMDTQGSEYEILQGAKKTLEDVKAILFEWSTVELYKDMKYFSDIQELLESYNFIMKEKINLWGDWHGDAIFSRENV